MNKYIFTFFLFVLIYVTIPTYSQEFESQIESIVDNISGSQYSENEIEYIEYRRLNKLNLLYASKNDIEQFPTFDIITARKIIDYMKINPNSNIAKLSKDLNLSSEQEIILDNCAFISISTENVFLLNSRTRNNLQFDKVYGFENHKFLGNKLEYTQKITSQINNIELGVVLDKDAGEMDFLDFYSGYIKYDNNKTRLIIGDYYIEFGLGNILARDFPTRKGSNIISPALNFGNGIRPSRSTLDYSFFRGIGIEQNFKLFNDKLNIELSLAGSLTAKSGNIDTVTGYVTSNYLTGLYRTQTEIAKKGTIDEKSIFGSVEFRFLDILFGIGTLYLDYNYPIQSSSSSAFQGKNGFLKSLWAKYENYNFAIGGEASLDALDNFGIKIGTVIDFDDYELAFHFRSFDENYRSQYGSIFGEFSNPANELGLYSGVIYKKLKNWRLSGFLDIYRSYGHTYYVPAQVQGFNIFLESNYKISNDIILLNRIVYENKTDNIKLNNINNLYQKQKLSFRNDIRYYYSENFNIRMRLEIVGIDYADFQAREFGAAGFIEFNYLPIHNLRLYSRISYYSTESYDSAIWQYEYFIAGMINTYAAYLDGGKYLFGIKYDFYNHFRVNLLYSNASKNDIIELSSGNDKILSNSTNQLILQLEIKY